MSHELIVHYEADIGHRVMHHNGKCANLHGHRYVFKVHFKMTRVVPREEGMLLDFGVAKSIVKNIVDEWDHGLLLNEQDPLLTLMRGVNFPGQKQEKIFAWEGDPTAENIGRDLEQELTLQLKLAHLPVEVVAVEVAETPTYTATWTP